MGQERTCAWVSREGWHCPRPIWEEGGKDETCCLFHATNYAAKMKMFM